MEELKSPGSTRSGIVELWIGIDVNQDVMYHSKATVSAEKDASQTASHPTVFQALLDSNLPPKRRHGRDSMMKR